MIRKCEGTFVETQVDGEVVLMNTASGTFFSLEGTGLAIWRAIDGARGRAEVIAETAREYSMDPAAIADDVDAFLSALAEAGLIAEQDPA